MESHTFYLIFEEKIRKKKNSYNTKKYKSTYNATVKMVTAVLNILPGYEEQKLDNGDTVEVLPLTKELEF